MSNLPVLPRGPHLDRWPCSSWAHLSAVAPLRTAGPAPCLGCTVGLALVVGVWLSCPKNMSAGELTLPLVCCVVALVHPLPPHPLPGAVERADLKVMRAGEQSCPSLAAGLRKWSLVKGTQMSQPSGCGCWRAGLTTCLPGGGVGTLVMQPFPPWPPAVVRIAGPEVMKSLPLTGERAGFAPQHSRASHGGGDASEPAQRHEHKKAGPVPHLLKHLGECPHSLHLYWTAQWSWLWRSG